MKLGMKPIPLLYSLQFNTVSNENMTAVRTSEMENIIVLLKLGTRDSA
jgi:hypothetical protein